jgi:hypothetical protein
MKIIYEVYEASALTVGDAELIKNSGLDLEMREADDGTKKILAVMDLRYLGEEDELGN